ncbi:MAG: DUF2799 domain-containing protein [Rhodobacteraceae bacterium]|nr:DUF2799 domain-containing protein [Paracoccaceae bacterium]
MLFRLLLVLAFAFSLAGCASLSESECQVGDWYSIGKSDGYSGYVSYERLGKHNKACREHGIAIDQQQYQLGYQAGLADYCTFQRGLSEGKGGKTYAGVCQGDSDIIFREGYALGQKYYQVSSKINTLKRDNARLENEMKKVAAGSGEFYKYDGEIKANLREITLLSVRLGEVQSELSRASASAGF